MTQRVIDLSLPIGLGTEDDPMSMATSYIGTPDHIGTHVDSFFHVKSDGLKIGEMPLELFFGKAVCSDLTYIPDLSHKRHYPNPEVPRPWRRVHVWARQISEAVIGLLVGGLAYAALEMFDARGAQPAAAVAR